METDGVEPRRLQVKGYGGLPPPVDQPGDVAMPKSKAVIGRDGGRGGDGGDDGNGGGEGGSGGGAAPQLTVTCATAASP